MIWSSEQSKAVAAVLEQGSDAATLTLYSNKCYISGTGVLETLDP